MQYKCPKCGNTIEEGTNPCPTCGQQFKWPESNNINSQETQQNQSSFGKINSTKMEKVDKKEECHKVLLNNDFFKLLLLSLEVTSEDENDIEGEIYFQIARAVLAGIRYVFLCEDDIYDPSVDLLDLDDEALNYLYQNTNRDIDIWTMQFPRSLPMIPTALRVVITEIAKNYLYENHDQKVETILSTAIDGLFLWEDSLMDNLTNGDLDRAFEIAIIRKEIAKIFFEMGKEIYINYPSEQNIVLALKCLHYCSDYIYIDEDKECGDLIRKIEPDYKTQQELWEEENKGEQDKKNFLGNNREKAEEIGKEVGSLVEKGFKKIVIIAIAIAIILILFIIAVKVVVNNRDKNNSADYNAYYNEPVTSSVAASSSSSNDKKSAKDIMGMWSGNSVTMKFAKDGTFYMADDVVVYVGTYNVDGNYVNLVLGSNTYTASFTLVNETLLFSFITPKEQTITLTKILDAEKSAYTISKNIKYLDGAYEIGSGTSIYRSGYFFTKDGMCRKYTNLDKVDEYTEGTYTIEDGMLTMSFGGASESYWLEETEYQLIFYNIRDGKATNYNLTTLIE